MKWYRIPALLCSFWISTLSCNNESATTTGSGTDSGSGGSHAVAPAQTFRDTVDGKPTDLFVLKNAKGVQATFTNYGGRLVSLLVPDKSGRMVDVSIGMNSVAEYAQSTEPYFGATIGRYGNRIAGGKF